MDSIWRAIDTAFKFCKVSTFFQVDVVEITEETCDIDVIEVDIGLDPNVSHQMENTDNNLVSHGSHVQVLDEESGMNENSEVETRLTDANAASRATESSEADGALNARKECLAGDEGSCLISEGVENVDTVRIPRKKSKWLADWLIEAAEWEGCSLSRDTGLCASQSSQRRASEENLPFRFSSINRRVNTAPTTGAFSPSQVQQERQ